MFDHKWQVLHFYPLPCRSKRVLGFRRSAEGKQAQLQWQQSAPVYGDDVRLSAGQMQADIPGGSTDDAAMAAADNVNWDFL